jgi:hypothetical protein
MVDPTTALKKIEQSLPGWVRGSLRNSMAHDFYLYVLRHDVVGQISLRTTSLTDVQVQTPVGEIMLKHRRITRGLNVGKFIQWSPV